MNITNPDRVSLFLPNLRGGGAERAMVSLARGFCERGLDVDLVLAWAEGAYLDDVPSGVELVDLEASRTIASLPGLVGYLRRKQPSVMLSALSPANVVARLARIVAGTSTRLVLSEQATLNETDKISPHWQDRWVIPTLMGWFYPGADRVVSVSQGVKDDLLDHLPLDREAIRVIYNPVVTPDLPEQADQPLDHPWFSDREPPVILGVGRLTALKDFTNLLEAFARLRRSLPARLVILGKGALRPELETHVRTLGIKDSVDLPGFVDNPYKYMKQADVFALSSRYEGLGNVLIEAMACGTPVVSTDCPIGPSEILEGGKHGRLVPVGDPEALAGAIREALIEPAGTGVERARDFTLDRAVDSYLELFRSVTGLDS